MFLFPGPDCAPSSSRGQKIAKTPAERMRESRQWKLQEVNAFIESLPGTSSMTDEEKLVRYNKMKAEEKQLRVETKKPEREMKEREQKMNKQVQKQRMNAERCKQYRARKKVESAKRKATDEISLDPIISEPPHRLFVDEPLVADCEFDRRFNQNTFGVSCAVCDRLWFQRDMKSIPSKASNVVREKYPNICLSTACVCDTCYKSLLDGKIPRLATINGFRYPPFPSELPPLDPVSERLVSPRLPFMQIRRLRFVHGSKGIIGQVINIPVNVNSMVSELPRQLEDDRAFNVHIKRHLIHKSTYLKGYVKKSVIKAWLKYLVAKPLYRMNGICIDESLYREYDNSPALAPVPEAEAEPMIQYIPEEPTHVNNLLLAKQHINVERGAVS